MLKSLRAYYYTAARLFLALNFDILTETIDYVDFSSILKWTF